MKRLINTRVTPFLVYERTEGLSVSDLCGIATVQLGRASVEFEFDIECSATIIVDGKKYKSELKVTTTEITE